MFNWQNMRDWALRALAFLGVGAILLLGAWGIIQIAFGISGFLSNLGNPAPGNTSGEVITVTAPQGTNSGTPVTLSWSHKNGSGSYEYAVSYACVQGVSVMAPLPNGSTQAVACNTPFNYTSAKESMTVTPIISGNEKASVMFTVSARKLSGTATTASGSSTVVVSPSANVATPNQPSTTGSSGQSTSGSKSTSKGTTSVKGSTKGFTPNPTLADLAVSINSLQPIGGRWSAQFTIENRGGTATPSNWTFNATFPAASQYSSTYTYQSDPQRALGPGDKIVYTMGFDMYNTAYAPASVATPWSGYPRSNCGYTISYTYNGTYNYPTPNYNCTGLYSYPQNAPTYNSLYNTYYPYSTNTTFSVQVDPQNYVTENVESNNASSVPVAY